MINRRTLLLSPIAAAVPLPAAGETQWDLSLLPKPNLIFSVPPNMSVLEAADAMQRIFDWGTLVPDILNRKVYFYRDRITRFSYANQ